jgi:hypothetical protein
MLIPRYDRNGEKFSLLMPLLLKWDQLVDDEKIKTFSKFGSHELNFFIFHRDHDFFNKIVRTYILNKLEKTFIDWYLLATDKDSENVFV